MAGTNPRLERSVQGGKTIRRALNRAACSDEEIREIQKPLADQFDLLDPKR
jgi:hypothetical protein